MFLKNKELADKNEVITLQTYSLEGENLAKQNALVSLGKAKDSIKTVSDSATNLKNLALAIRHSEKSLAIPVNDSNRQDIKAHLALFAYQLYLNSGQQDDKKLQARVYSALYYALSKKPSNNDVWQVTSYKNESDHLADAAIANLQNKGSMIYLTAEDKSLYSFNLETKK